MTQSDPPEMRGASRTALGVAAIRAAHEIAGDEPKILRDPIAHRLLDDDVARAISAGVDSRGRDPSVKALRAQVLLRSRFAEDRLAQAVARGVRQCVILGAGLDTFAYRQPDWAKDLHVFEVDHPASQADKRARLARAGITPPANLDYVAIDLETTSLRDGLAASALDFSQPAFFTCLGVMIYLTPAAVDAIFELVGGFPAGSEIAFTYSQPRLRPSPLAARVSAQGEPWLTYVTRGDLTRQLKRHGFLERTFLDFEQARRAYFPARRRDGLEPPRRGSIAAAVVG
jgi:methyltransferase (TIGR00027 family)